MVNISNEYLVSKRYYQLSKCREYNRIRRRVAVVTCLYTYSSNSSCSMIHAFSLRWFIHAYTTLDAHFSDHCTQMLQQTLSVDTVK